MDTFYTWSGAVRKLNEKVERMRPLAGNGISIERTPGGHRISQHGVQDSTVSGYNGPFKLEISEEETIEILDGSGVFEFHAGYVMFNGSVIAVENDSCNIAGISGFVCLKAEVDSDTLEPVFSFSLAETPISEDDDIAIYPLGYLLKDDAGNKLIQFYHSLPQLWLIGDCNNQASS